MEKEAIIKVSSIQINNDNDQIEVISNGSFKILENGFEASYEESEISGMEGTTTTLKIEEGKVTLERKGTTESLIVFENDGSHISLYNTPYGMLELVTKTKVLEIDINENGGTVKIDYELGVSGEKSIKTNLSLDIRAR